MIFKKFAVKEKLEIVIGAAEPRAGVRITLRIQHLILTLGTKAMSNYGQGVLFMLFLTKLRKRLLLTLNCEKISDLRFNNARK